MDAYGTDLAYIHDVGFSSFATAAAPGVLAILRQHAIHRGLVIDLGCGSGIWARILNDAGYDVLGIDYSAAMIALARTKVPRATFRHGSYLTVPLPPCDAVTSIGECLNYLFDRNPATQLDRLFVRVHAALRPGGIFAFDVLEPGQMPVGHVRKSHRTADDWTVLVEVEEDPDQSVLTRRITNFRRIGKLYRRSEEVHRLRLYQGRDLAESLRRAGFRVRLRRGYGDFRLDRYGEFPRRHAVIVAHKP
jgi:SAM-dependent methyltransferase